jgi:hypothetical protein
MLAANTNAKGSKRRRIVVLDIKCRDWTRFGRKTEGEVMKGHHAVIVPGESIALFGTETKVEYVRTANGTFDYNHVPVAYERRFRVGDMAEYDAFNLVYFGPIVAISEKTITIRDKHSARNHKLDIATFSRRNRDFTVESATKRNSEWSD